VFAIALYHRDFPLRKLSHHARVKAFLKGARRVSPTWDLQLVLLALKEAPFEQMVSGVLSRLTWKTAITMAKKVGELKDLSVDARYCSI